MARPRSIVARTKAIEAAQALLAEDGLTRFTMDGVAKRSGVAKTTLYRHWGSGSELLVEAIDCQVQKVTTPDTGSLEGDLHELIERFVATATSAETKGLLLDLLAAAARNDELAALHDAMIAQRTRPIREVIERAVGRGEIPATDIDVAELFVEGPFIARILRSTDLVETDDMTPFVGLILRGLGAQTDD